MDIKKTMQNLDKNGIKPYFVEKKGRCGTAC